MDQYEPKIIIAPENYDEFLLSLHRSLGKLAEDRDPPNPFRSLLHEGDNVRIVVNDTNDLYFCIKHFEEKINNGELENVVIGDPHTFGYGVELLERMTTEIEIATTWYKDNTWIYILINIDKSNLVIENGKIRVEK